MNSSLKTSWEHVKHVKSIIGGKEKSKTPICPKCGSAMKLREAKRGEKAGQNFWGCSGYPNCRSVLDFIG